MTFKRFDKLQGKLKILQPKPEKVDAELYSTLIGLSLDHIVYEVSAFINTPVEELPEALDGLMVLRLSAWFTDAGVFMDAVERHTGRVTGVTEGDTSITYGSPQQALQAMGKVSFIDDDFRVLLMRHRRLRG